MYREELDRQRRGTTAAEERATRAEEELARLREETAQPKDEPPDSVLARLVAKTERICVLEQRVDQLATEKESEVVKRQEAERQMTDANLRDTELRQLHDEISLQVATAARLEEENSVLSMRLTGAKVLVRRAQSRSASPAPRSLNRCPYCEHCRAIGALE